MPVLTTLVHLRAFRVEMDRWSMSVDGLLINYTLSTEKKQAHSKIEGPTPIKDQGEIPPNTENYKTTSESSMPVS